MSLTRSPHSPRCKQLTLIKSLMQALDSSRPYDKVRVVGERQRLRKKHSLSHRPLHFGLTKRLSGKPKPPPLATKAETPMKLGAWPMFLRERKLLVTRVIPNNEIPNRLDDDT